MAFLMATIHHQHQYNYLFNVYILNFCLFLINLILNKQASSSVLGIIIGCVLGILCFISLILLGLFVLKKMGKIGKHLNFL
jgi:hypothetical protein